MELYKPIQNLSFKLSTDLDPIVYFKLAHSFMQTHHKEDFDRIANTDFNTITPEFFWSEYIWVVYASGFSSKIISKLYPKLLDAYSLAKHEFLDYAHNHLDIKDRGLYMKKSLSIVNNKIKAFSVFEMSHREGLALSDIGWDKYRSSLDNPEKLQRLPYIGPITCYHLARNLGQLKWVKPDLHLTRLSKHWGFADPIEMCKAIQKEVNMPLGLIDLVLFYAARNFGSK